MESFHNPPTVILSSSARSRLKVHFFKIALTYVSNKQIIGLTVKRKAPWIS